MITGRALIEGSGAGVPAASGTLFVAFSTGVGFTGSPFSTRWAAPLFLMSVASFELEDKEDSLGPGVDAFLLSLFVPWDSDVGLGSDFLFCFCFDVGALASSFVFSVLDSAAFFWLGDSLGSVSDFFVNPTLLFRCDDSFD